MAFFEVPDADPVRPEIRAARSQWARPARYIGASVGDDVVLARSADAAVVVQCMRGFPTGFEFQVAAHLVVKGDVWDPMHGLQGPRMQPGASRADEDLRFGIEFSNRRRATNLRPPLLGDATEAEGPILVPHSGNAHETDEATHRWIVEVTFWVSALLDAASEDGTPGQGHPMS